MKRDNITELFKLIKENPDLPIIPMVDSDVVADDYCACWEGSWGIARVDEYLYASGPFESIIFKSDDEVFDALEHYLPEEDYEKIPNDVEEARPYFEALPWKRAIIVYIGLPENGGNGYNSYQKGLIPEKLKTLLEQIK